MHTSAGISRASGPWPGKSSQQCVPSPDPVLLTPATSEHRLQFAQPQSVRMASIEADGLGRPQHKPELTTSVSPQRGCDVALVCHSSTLCDLPQLGTPSHSLGET